MLQVLPLYEALCKLSWGWIEFVPVMCAVWILRSVFGGRPEQLLSLKHICTHQYEHTHTSDSLTIVCSNNDQQPERQMNNVKKPWQPTQVWGGFVFYHCRRFVSFSSADIRFHYLSCFFKWNILTQTLSENGEFLPVKRREAIQTSGAPLHLFIISTNQTEMWKLDI